MQLRDSTDSLLVEKREKITISATVSWQKLLSEFTAEQDGNLTVFIDNSDLEPVYFDNLELRVESDPTLVITQEHHYYPFGMNMSGIERDGDLMYQFNGMVEKEEAFGLELYETPFRSYDTQLGRFWQVEPLADEFHSISMFQFAFNNPVNMNDPMGLSPKQQKRDLEGFLLDFFNKSASGSELKGDAFQSAFGAYMGGANMEYGANSAGESGYWFDYGSQGFTDADGSQGVRSKQSIFVQHTQAKSLGRALAMPAWQEAFQNAGSWMEDTFGDGQNMQGAAQFIADLNPLTNAAHLLAKYQTGNNAYGESMGKGGVAMAAIGLIPAGNSVKAPLKFINFIPRLFNNRLFNCVDAAIQMEKALAGKYWSPLIFHSKGGNFDKILKTFKTSGLEDIDAGKLFENLGERGIIFLDRGLDIKGNALPGHYINYLKQADGSMLFLDAQWNKSFNSFDRFMQPPFNGRFGLIRTK